MKQIAGSKTHISRPQTKRKAFDIFLLAMPDSYLHKDYAFSTGIPLGRSHTRQIFMIILNSALGLCGFSLIKTKKFQCFLCFYYIIFIISCQSFPILS
jgi:hypothetical protein